MEGLYQLRPIQPAIINKISKDTSTLVVPIADSVFWNNQTPGVINFQSGLYTGLIQTAREIVEKYIWQDLTQCTYQAYYELERYGVFQWFIDNVRLVLPKAPIFNINNILKIEYLDNVTGAWDSFDIGLVQGSPGLYANVTERQEANTWASLYFINPPPWASTLNAYKARVTFTVGFDWSYNGIATLSYNSTTGVVTCITPAVNLLNNNGMTITMAGTTQVEYGQNNVPINVISSTTFTYQLATGLSLAADNGTYTSTPNSLYTMPYTLQTAINNIVAFNYANRGDSIFPEDLNGYPCPAGTKNILNQYNIGLTQIGQGI